MRELEPVSFDRTLRAAALELERRAKTGEALNDALPPQLLDAETLHWLRESRTKDPLAAALERWLLRLREQVELDPQRRELGRAYRVERHEISEPEGALLPLTAMLALSLARRRERAAYLRSFFACAAAVADRVRRLWEERLMFAERLGTSLDSFEVASAALEPAALAFVEASRGAFESLEVQGPERLVTSALAESADEGWPARLTARTTLDLLGDRTWVHGLRLRPFPLPTAHGAGSFSLALNNAGRAISDAGNALRSPFVLATDVFDLHRNRLGALLGMLPLSASFATRQLGVSPSRVRDQQRTLARAALVELRVAAFRVRLRGLFALGPKAIANELPELSHGALGFELPASVAGAFIRVRPRDSQRFAGALLASSRHETLVNEYDEDWFRNPRAISELRAELDQPDPSEPDDLALSTGAAAFLARLGALL